MKRRINRFGAIREVGRIAFGYGRAWWARDRDDLAASPPPAPRSAVSRSEPADRQAA